MEIEMFTNDKRLLDLLGLKYTDKCKDESSGIFDDLGRDEMVEGTRAIKEMIDVCVEAGFSFEEAIEFIVTMTKLAKGEDE